MCQVVFEEQNAHRRKSSIVLNEAPKVAQEVNKSMCYVHSLVEKSQKGIQGPKLPGIREEELGKADKLISNGDASPPQDHTQSRLLTKKQLSDMAMSVRSLAKKLGSIRVKLKIRTVFLLTKAHDQTLIGKTREVAKWLLSKDRDIPYIVYVENTLEHNNAFDAAGLLNESPEYEGRLKYWNNELAKRKPHTFDLVVTLGGDGTVLYASWLFQRVVPPVLSFALGSLGFLTKFDFNHFEDTLTKALRDGVTISLRLRFEGTIMRSQKRYGSTERRDLVEELEREEGDDHRTHKPERTFEILNDIVVDRGPNPTMSTIELFGDEEHLTTVQADGVCVATPTGSTAYNLAAGGSLCHPENPVILVTAICAHTLSFRPIILPDSMVLRIGVPYDARANSWVSFDGRERVELCPGDYVTISASRYPFANVMPPGRRSEDWINSLSRTLQWNSRQRQKAFNEWDDMNEKEDAEDIQPRNRAGQGHGGYT